MSLGWNTESALLPSKAKAIAVSQTSMLDLKAIVYEREEQRRQRQQQRGGSSSSGSSSSSHGGGSSSDLRRRRGERGDAAAGEASSRKASVFARSNRGVGERGAADEEARQADKVRAFEGLVRARL